MADNNLSDWEKFNLLLWKNFNVQWNNRVQLVLTVLAPILFCLLLVGLRVLIEVEVLSTESYEKIFLDEAWKVLIFNLIQRKKTMDAKLINFTYNNFVPRLIVSYAPNTFEAFNNIMELAETFMLNVTVDSFTSCEEVRDVIMTKHHIAGICFDDSLMHERPVDSQDTFSIYPRHLNYSLVFPSELRFYDNDHIGATWATNVLYDLSGKSIERVQVNKYYNHIAYVREGFVSLQHYVAMAYIHLISKKPKFPTLCLERFPDTHYSNDKMAVGNKIFVPFVILCGFMYPVLYLITWIVWEKKRRLKATMKILGLQNWIQLCAWLVNGFTIMLIDSILALGILKVHWYDGYSILNRSSGAVLLLFLISYNLVSVCFCGLISAFFNSDITSAVVISGILWYLSFMPYLITVNDLEYEQLDVTQYIFSNVAMGKAFNIILDFELHAHGLQWNNLFSRIPTRNTRSVGEFIVIFLLLSIIYTVVASYAEPMTVGMYYVFQKTTECYLRSKEGRLSSNRYTFSKSLAQVWEVAPERKNIAVYINDLTKSYNDDTVVNEVSMNLYEGDITCLMGHNGCGKTTLMSMIVGLIPPTYGSVTISGFSIRTQPQFAYANIGICLRDKVLFRDLTVANQIAFFSRLNGMNDENVEREVQKYLLAMNLHDKRNILTRDLTVGLRQHLAVCCALAGNTKVVFLDEADAGMDLCSRRLLWTMLNNEKKDRTIFISTHSTENTEAVADRVAVMSGGELTCYGSTIFLKKVYGYGFRLVCNTNQNCDINEVTKVLQKYIPHITPECNIGTELSYVLDMKYIEVFSKLLNELENKLDILNLERCAISDTTMDDIFYRMGSEDISDNDRHRHSQIMNGLSVFVEEYKHLSFAKRFKRLKGFQLGLSHWMAMLLKRFTYIRRNVALIFCVLYMLPIIFTVISHMLIGGHRAKLNPMFFNIMQYGYQTITVLDQKSNQDNLTSLISQSYHDSSDWIGIDHNIHQIDGKIFSDYMLEKAQTTSYFKHKYLIGVTFGKNTIIAWFNAFALHSAPLTLNKVHNAMLEATSSDRNGHISVGIDPLPYISPHYTTLSSTPMCLFKFLALNVSVCASFIWAFLIIYVVKERESRFKLMQLISGVTLLRLWMSTYVYDFVKLLLMATSIVITMLLFNRDHFNTFSLTGWYFLAMLISAACIKPFNYMMSSFFKDPVMGYAVVLSIYIFGCIGFYAFAVFFRISYNKPLNTAVQYEQFFSIFPSFVLSNMLIKTAIFGEVEQICDVEAIKVISTHLDDCKYMPNCCLDYGMWDWKTGITPDILYYFVLSALSLFLLCCIENRNFCRKHHLFSRKNNDTESTYKNFKWRHERNSSEMDDTLIYEKLRILSLSPRDYYSKALVCERIGMFQDHRETINHLYLILQRGEIFGLFGVNGSGKSTILEMIIGTMKLPMGRVFIEGINAHTNLEKVFQNIGYCSQRNILPADYTGYELMKIFCLLRGVPRNSVTQMCVNLAKVLGFYKYLHKLTRLYSNGNIGRLKIAIAFLGKPRLVFLDDPTSYIDPSGKRHVWNIMCKYRNSGNSVFLTSSDPPTAEIICDRIGVISSGCLLCVDTPWELIRKYSSGYLLSVKVLRILEFVNRSIKFSYSTILSPDIKLTAFVETEFPNSILKEQHGTVLYFQVPQEDNTMARIFNKISKSTFFLNAEHFAIARDSLSIIFLDLEEKQNELNRISIDSTLSETVNFKNTSY